MTRPVGYGLSWSTRAFTGQGGRPSRQPNDTILYGTGPLFGHIPAVNCQVAFADYGAPNGD
ncbi:MAG: hypothetical protein JOZ31_14025 [Verrucomicrobia bacterium]|nr:hypothetical protein [Verrucomicrobiota bacterium]